MQRSILALVMGASLGIATVAAFAQEAKTNDPNNPAPNYTPSSTGVGADAPSTINDGNNSAPNYKPSAGGTSTQTTSKIMDGNNPAPNYNGPAAPSAPVKHASAPKRTHHATHHHKAHNPTT
ncbi:MAG: hypothetical protein ACXWKA_06305 [Xanthobacteraceae bacterium]